MSALIERAIKQVFPAELDAVLGSVAGLLTAFSLHRHDATPLTTVDRIAGWAGIDIHHAMLTTDAWLNLPSRHHLLAIASLVVSALMVARVLYGEATDYQQLDAARWIARGDAKRTVELHQQYSAFRFGLRRRLWVCLFSAAAMLACLHELTWRRVGIAGGVVGICLALGTAFDVIAGSLKEGQRIFVRKQVIRTASMATFFNLLEGALTLISFPLGVWAFITYPRAAPRAKQTKGEESPATAD